MKALLKRMLRPFYRATKKVLRPIAARIRGPLSSLLYPPEFETVFRNLEQITNNLKSYVDQSDQLLLAMFRTLHLPSASRSDAATFAPVNLGNGRVLAKHPTAPFLFVDAGDLRETPRILSNTWQPHLTEALRRIVSPGWCCVDLGAGVGFHALTMALAAGAAARGFAIELDDSKAAILRDNLTANELAETFVACPPMGTSADAQLWLRERLRALGGAPDLVRIAGDFPIDAVIADLRAWVATGATRFLLSSQTGVGVAAELKDYSFWSIAADGSLFRATLAEIEERGRLSELHFLAARALD